MVRKLFSILVLLGVLLATTSFAGGRILQVDRTLSLTEKDSGLTDYVINVGQNHGLQPGTWLDVYRRRPVADLVNFDSSNDLRVWVGQLEVIHAESKISVARLKGIANPHDQPLLEYALPLSGDYVEIGKPRKPTSIKTERVPGIFAVKRKGRKFFLSKDARNYARKVAYYLKKHRHKVRAVHLVGRHRKHANTVAQAIRRHLRGRSPAMKYVETTATSLPSRGVVVIVKRI